MPLFDLDRVSPWTGSRALVIRDSEACTWCGTIYRSTWTTVALFRHGGYGAAEEVTAVWCQCGALTRRSVATRNPRHV